MKTSRATTILLVLLIELSSSERLQIVPLNRELVYEYEGSVSVQAQVPWYEIDLDSQPPQSSGWKVRGTFKLQRIDNVTLAASLVIEKTTVDKENGTFATFYQNKEMQSLYNPFKIIYLGDVITGIQFKTTDPLWARNFKRAIASTLQVQSIKLGAYVENEAGIHGICTTEYFLSIESDNHLSVRKTPQLNSCLQNIDGIHSHRKNIPEMMCDPNAERIVIVGNEAVYDLIPRSSVTDNETGEIEYYLNTVNVKGSTLLQTFKSTGESQFIISKLSLLHVTESDIVNQIDVTSEMSTVLSSLETEEYDHADVTGGRQPSNARELVRHAIDLLINLAKSLENDQLDFDEPYESRVAELIRIIGRCDVDSLQLLYAEIDVGTSYLLETVRNLFYDVLPRIGTKAAVLLTRDLVVRNLCKPTTAIQLLITVPFHIANPSADLVEECEILMSLGSERPDVRQVGILSFATIVYNSYSQGKLSVHKFEKYVKKYFDLFLGGYDYEQKMLYLQGLRNMKLGKVMDYLDPIVRDESQSDDIRFHAMWIESTMARQLDRNDKYKNYETFWPIAENRTAALELRAAALIALLSANPTPARLISIHALMEAETDPHLINFYRTTILSLAGSHQPCHGPLRSLALSMVRHLPKEPAKRYWVTGNYIFDYRNNQFGIGASLQALLIANSKTHLPQIAFFKLEQEGLGKYISQHMLYIKARGLDEIVFKNLLRATPGTEIPLNKLRELLSALKMPLIQRTPVHLEIILQIEGKSVLIFFLNQDSYNSLTEGDIINRITKMLQIDSHINLQNLRWPFYVRYSVPTVLGTPSSLVIQSTVLSSLRGNITQSIQPTTLTRNHEIDVRHSTYTVVTSKSYNPFLNLEHSINREQGFLAYLPINNEVVINWSKETFWFSFYRPNDFVSGLSLKSRTRTITKGRLLSTNYSPYVEESVTEGSSSLKTRKIIDYELKDLGLNVTCISNHRPAQYSIINNYRLLMAMDTPANTFSQYNVNYMENIKSLWNLLQVNNVYIGTNRRLTLLLHNTKNTKLEGMIRLHSGKHEVIDDEFTITDNKSFGVHVTLEHKSDDHVLQNLAAFLKVNDFQNSGMFKLSTKIRHVDTKKQEWKLCTEMIYEPIVFLVRPYSLRGFIYFGDSNETQPQCPQDQTNITFEVHADVSQEAKIDYKTDGNVLEGELICPREILKFTPPAQNDKCTRRIFPQITTLREYGLNFTFENSPKWLANLLNRLDHFVTAFSNDITSFNLKNGISATIIGNTNRSLLNVKLNGQNALFPNFLQNFDAKFDTRAQHAYESRDIYMCSIIADTVFTFEDQSLAFNNYTKSNCSTLLAADCSASPKFALFVSSTRKEDSSLAFTLTLHIDEEIVSYTPLPGRANIVLLNGKREVQIDSEAWPLENGDKLRVYINEENLLIFDLYMNIEIQYYGGNVLTVKIPSTLKGNMCGLCSLPFNIGEMYTQCQQ